MTDIYMASDEEIAKMAELPEQDTPPAPESEQPKDTQTDAPEPVATDKTEPEPTDSDNNSEKVDNLNKSDIKENNQEPDNQEIDYKGFYEKVMAPIKANGHTIQLKSQEEVIKLIQQGANYTKKMQEFAPYRKVAYMLKNNNLLDEDKLSLLIDVNKGDKAALGKLLKEQSIDPLDVDTEAEYTAGANKLSDSYVQFKESYDSLLSQEKGLETIRLFDQYDKESQQTLIDHPELMQMLHEQVQDGFYQRVCDEISRQKMLGQLSPNMGFLKAYNQIGNSLMQSQQANQQKQPIDIQPRFSKSNYTNNKQAKSASVTRTSTSTPQTVPNYLEMSDEEFEKQFGNINI